MAENINPINFNVIISFSTDYEYEQIKRRLMMYGVKPSGSKSADKMKLHEIELREARKENVVTTKFLTVSTSEQEKIQEKKKQKRIEINPKSHPETMKGQRILGEQIMLTIKMKKELENRDKDKKIKEKEKKKEI